MGSLIFILILAFAVLFLTVISPFLSSRRAIPKVIRIFREAGAIGKRNARPMEELLPRPGKRSIIKMMYAPRDYRLNALVTLLQKNIVQKTEDGKLFLSEKELKISKWKGI